MNKSMRLKRGDIVIYRKYNFLTGDEYIDQCIINTSAGETIEEYETCAGLEIIKLKRPIKWKNVYEHKEILDEQEKDYLGKVIEPFKKRVIRIEKIKKLYGNSEFINIVLYSSISCNKEESIQLPYFKKGKMYKGMKLDKKYTLKELGLD